MPTLTMLTRAPNICVTTWESPDGTERQVDVPTPITNRQIQDLFHGIHPRPASVPNDWRFVSSSVHGIFTNGRGVIGPNEMGDLSGYAADYTRAPERLVAVIQEAGDLPVTVTIPPERLVRDGSNRVSTTEDVEASPTTRTRAETIPTYRIVDNVATKVSER